MEKRFSELKKDYPDFAAFDKNFVVDSLFMGNFFAFAEKQGVKKVDKDYLLSEKLIKSQIKGLVAQKLWDMNELYAIINQYDEEVQKAVEVLQNDSYFEKLNIAR